MPERRSLGAGRVEPVFRVLLGNRAKKSLDAADSKIKRRLDEVLARLEIDPLPAKLFDLKKIKGATAIYRIRISDRRIIYEVDWKNKVVKIIKAERRSDSTYS